MFKCSLFSFSKKWNAVILAYIIGYLLIGACWSIRKDLKLQHSPTNYLNDSEMESLWCRGIVVITTAQLHSTKPELRFCAGSNPACRVSEIRDGEDLWQWSRLEIRLNAFLRSTIPQKKFITLIIIIIFIIIIIIIKCSCNNFYFVCLWKPFRNFISNIILLTVPETCAIVRVRAGTHTQVKLHFQFIARAKS